MKLIKEYKNDKVEITVHLMLGDGRYCLRIYNPETRIQTEIIYLEQEQINWNIKKLCEIWKIDYEAIGGI